jgi:hypothetical protein
MDPSELATASVSNIRLTVETSLLSAFYELLQAGFLVKCKAGVSIENLFYDQFKLDPRLTEEKISTIFLNGKPVDDIASTAVKDGSTLALSGAMPGLVGATLRRRSPLASFRKSISVEKNLKDHEKAEGYIRIKLFNVLLKELGPDFLKRGIFVSSGSLVAFFNKQSADFWLRCVEIVVDGQSTNAKQLGREPLEANSGMILLSVKTSPNVAIS